MLAQTTLNIAVCALFLTGAPREPLTANSKPEPPAPTAAKLSALDPFVGEWLGTTPTEQGQGRLTIKAVYKKILNDSCVEYSSEVRSGDELMFTQTAILSWDKDSEMIKAWGFRSNGQRWEGSWDPNREKNAAPGSKVWISEFTIKMPEGDDLTGTSIKTVKGSDAYTEVISIRNSDGQGQTDLPAIEFKRQKSK